MKGFITISVGGDSGKGEINDMFTGPDGSDSTKVFFSEAKAEEWAKIINEKYPEEHWGAAPWVVVEVEMVGEK